MLSFIESYNQMKIIISLLLSLSSVAAHAQTKQTVPVLMYHEVHETKAPGNEVVREARFREHMQFLKDNGYTTITVSKLVNFMNGNLELPVKSVAITLDDGWRSNLTAAKILEELNLNATFYILSGAFFDPQYLSENDVIYLSKNKNFEIGAHSHTHFMSWASDLSKMDTKIMDNELSMSKSILENTIKKPVKSFSWPFGYTRPGSIESASRLGFTSTVLVNQTTDNSAGMTPLEIRRISVSGLCNATQLGEMLVSGRLNLCK
jgi:peptidoglycan/xylan/chitin deacetylase (PgdA/CDA1 family)